MVTGNPQFWGHSLEDYCGMFALTESDLSKRILDCGSGPSSFNAEMQKLHHRVISIDEIYRIPLPELQEHINITNESALNKIAKHLDRYVWTTFGSFEDYKKNRENSLNLFFEDYPKGRESGRYLPVLLQDLPFNPLEFELALCTHYLFSNRFEPNLPLHLDIIHQLLRVANEVRIFPLLDPVGNVSPLLGPLMLALQENDLVGVELRLVDYHFQKQGNAMLRIWGQTCDIESTKEPQT